MRIRLENKVSSNFKYVFSSILNCENYMHVLKGGRYSSKSVTVGEAVVLGVMKSKKSAICLMQYKSDLGTKIVDNFTFCINNLGVEKHWKLKKSPYEYVLLDSKGKETSISIRFYGCDNVQDTKGFKSRTGEGFKYIWFEEANRFKNWNVIQSIIDTCDRLTDTKATVILTYNPPRDASSWVNEKFDVPVGKALGYKTNIGIRRYSFNKDGETVEKNTLIHHSTIEDLIAAGHSDWVADGIYGSAMESKEYNNKFYRWNYLGECIGGDATVFWNITDWTYDENISEKVGSVLFKYGLDVSNGGNDPYAMAKLLWVPDANDLYVLNSKQIVGNIGTVGVDNTDMDGVYGLVADELRKLIDTRYNAVFGDGVVKNIVQSINNKTNGEPYIISAKQGFQYSKQRSIGFFQGLNHIYIDKLHDPIAYEQFKKYSYKLDKEDNVTCILQDGNDHIIDASLYGMVDVVAYE